MKRVAVVVLNWNGWRHTISCLESLRRLEYPDFELVVVDNASTDGSVEQIQRAIPEVRVLQSGANLGFGGGCNIGIVQALQAGFEYIWLINSDASCDPQALTELVRMADKDRKLGVLGAVIYDANDRTKIQLWGGGKVQLWSGVTRHLRGPGKPDFISGASALLRCSAIKEVGMFDSETFFMYWEDTDLCFKLRAAGWAIGVAPTAKVWHHESSSLGKGSAMLDLYFTQSGVRFLRRHASCASFSIALMLARMLLKRLVLRDWQRVRAVLSGYQAA